MVNKIYEEASHKMDQSVQNLSGKYARMRGDRARVDLVEDIKVDCYGSKMNIKQLANISIPEPRLVVIEPWDKSILTHIERAILTSELGINPSNDGNMIRLSIPSLTEERREEIVRMVRQWGEETKVVIRNYRREAREKIEQLEKDNEISEDEMRRAQKEIQTLTDDFISRIDEMQEKKTKEVRQV